MHLENIFCCYTTLRIVQSGSSKQCGKSWLHPIQLIQTVPLSISNPGFVEDGSPFTVYLPVSMSNFTTPQTALWSMPFDFVVGWNAVSSRCGTAVRHVQSLKIWPETHWGYVLWSGYDVYKKPQRRGRWNVSWHDISSLQLNSSAAQN